METRLVRVAISVIQNTKCSDRKYFCPSTTLGSKTNEVETWLNSNGFTSDVVTAFKRAGLENLEDTLFCKDADLQEIYPEMTKAVRLKFLRLAGQGSSGFKLMLPQTIPKYSSPYDGSKASFPTFLRWYLDVLARFIQVDTLKLGQAILGFYTS